MRNPDLTDNDTLITTLRRNNHLITPPKPTIIPEESKLIGI